MMVMIQFGGVLVQLYRLEYQSFVNLVVLYLTPLFCEMPYPKMTTIAINRPFQMRALQGLPYLAYDNVNPAMVNSMMLRSSILAFETVSWSCKTSYPLRGLQYLAYDNVNPTMVNSMMLRSSMLPLKRSIEQNFCELHFVLAGKVFFR